MSDPVNDFALQLEAMAPSLKGWGRFVVDKISELVKADVGGERYSTFFKIKPEFRLKNIDSALKKQQKKKYPNPLEQMTDLVGARFVVLLLTDISIVENVLKGYSGWVISRDRHFDDEVALDPEVFDYQSVHYLVRNPQDFDADGLTISEGVVCEVQIRTLLQHAYAEMAHDRIYKSTGHVPTSAKRLVARSMALMETTDQMFCEAVHELEKVNAGRQGWAKELESLYVTFPGCQLPVGDVEQATLVFDTYRHLLERASIEDVREIVDVPVIKSRIASRASNSSLFKSPVCLACYWLVANHLDETLRHWPLEQYSRDIEQICADLGRSFQRAGWN